MKNNWPWIIGGAITIWYLMCGSSSSLPYGETAMLPTGPTTYADPTTSVQAGGGNLAQTTTSLATLSAQGPYATVG